MGGYASTCYASSDIAERDINATVTTDDNAGVNGEAAEEADQAEIAKAAKDAEIVEFMNTNEQISKRNSQIFYLSMRALYVMGDSKEIFEDQARHCKEDIKVLLRSKFGEAAEAHIAYLDAVWENTGNTVTGQDQQQTRMQSKMIFDYFLLPEENSAKNAMSWERFDEVVYNEICKNKEHLRNDETLKGDVWLLLHRAGNVSDEMDWRMFLRMKGYGQVAEFQAAVSEYLDQTIRTRPRELMHAQIRSLNGNVPPELLGQQSFLDRLDRTKSDDDIDHKEAEMQQRKLDKMMKDITKTQTLIETDTQNMESVPDIYVSPPQS